RQDISEILEQTNAIEYAMGQFYRKGSERDLMRAHEDQEIMRVAVERLGTLIENGDSEEAAESKINEPAA
ncbi:MAG: hypothetical protein AB7G08_26200, partial [Hyphomicrobiaceae bacterium]